MADYKKIVQFFLSPRNLFILGFAATFGLSFLEVWGEKNFNFMIYADATHDFLNGISPYMARWTASHGDQFLYGPLFTVLFTPFALLPPWLGSILWNMFNFTMLFWAIYSLPEKYAREQKSKTFLYIFLILATTQLSFQYNVVVAYCFIFAFSLLERGRSFWAIVLILLSGFTKIYGIFQLGLLLCYPRFWRNMGYVALAGVVLLALPALKTGLDGLLPYYGEWFDGLGAERLRNGHQSFFYMHPLLFKLEPVSHWIQAGIITALAALLVARRKRWPDFAFRAQALGVLMCYVILFSDSCQKHTYVIALLGYMLWHWSRTPSVTDRVLFCLNFVLLCAVPVDLLCPVGVMNLLCNVLYINLWVLLFTWLRMIWITFLRPAQETLPPDSDKSGAKSDQDETAEREP